MEPNRLPAQARPNVVQADHDREETSSEARPTTEQVRFEGKEPDLPAYPGRREGSSLPWLGNMSAGQPAAEDDSWRDTPPLAEQLFDATVGRVMATFLRWLMPPEASLQRKIVGVAILALIGFVILVSTTAFVLFNI